MMKAIALMLCVISPAFAAKLEPAKLAEDKALVTPPPTDWLKIYPLAPYKEIWTLSLSVKDLKSDLPRVLKAFEKAKAEPTQALANFAGSATSKTQQLSYRMPLKSAKGVLKALRKIGTAPDPIVRPNMEPVPLSEVKDKIAKLSAERAAHAKELAAMPIAEAMQEELLGHLRMVEAVREKIDGEALLNLTVSERR